MVIKINNADFSGCGIGIMPFTISKKAKEIVSLYGISDADKKERAEIATQGLMDQLGYGINGSIWSKMEILMLPCVADSLADTFINVIDGEKLNNVGESDDILNLYELSNGGLHWSYSKAYSYYQSCGGEEETIPNNWCINNVTVKEKTFTNTIKSGVVTVNNVVQPENSFILSLNTGTGGIQPFKNGNLGLKWLYISPRHTGSINIIKNIETDITKTNMLQSASYSVYDFTNTTINGLRYKGSYGLDVNATGIKDITTPITITNASNTNILYPCMSSITGNTYKNTVYCLAYMGDVMSEEEIVLCNTAFDNFAKRIIEV